MEVLDGARRRAARVVSSGGAGLGSGGGAGFTGFTGGFTGENEGLLDVCFAPNAGGVSFAASGRKGRVFLWDARCAAAPRATLHAPGASAASSKAAVRCVRFGCDGQTVLAGTGAGEIHVWDLRGGSGSGFSKTSKGAGSAFSVASRRTTSFPGAFTTRVADALALAPTLSGGHLDAPARRLWQDAMRSGVDWCEQDPHDPRRVGFHLNGGWSGVLDLASGDKDGGDPDGDARALPGAAVRAGRGRRRAGARARALAACAGAQAHGGLGSRTARGARSARRSWSGVREPPACARWTPPTPAARRWVAGVTEEDLDAEERFEARAFRRLVEERGREGRGSFSRDVSSKASFGRLGDAAIAEAEPLDAKKIRSRGGGVAGRADGDVRPAVAVAAHPAAHAACAARERPAVDGAEKSHVRRLNAGGTDTVAARTNTYYEGS